MVVPKLSGGKGTMKRPIARLFTFVAALFLPAVVAAQGMTGSISGTVTDPQKAVMPGVVLVVTHTETGAMRTQVSDEHGRYRALDLPPGTYEVTAELSGFLKVTRNELVVA